MNTLQIANKSRKVTLTFCENNDALVYHKIVLSKHKASLRTAQKNQPVRINKAQQVKRFNALLKASKQGIASFNAGFLSGQYSITSTSDGKFKVNELMSSTGDISSIEYEITKEDLDRLEEGLKAL